jgi:hypothetical protein
MTQQVLNTISVHAEVFKALLETPALLVSRPYLLVTKHA